LPGRVLALFLGWFLTFVAIGMIGSGRGRAILGAATPHGGLLQAAVLVVVADAVFLGLLATRGSERSKVIIGFFAVAGMFASAFALSQLPQAWRGETAAAEYVRTHPPAESSGEPGR